MTTSFKDWQKQTITAGGTGTVTLGAAVTNYQAFGAGDDGKSFTMSFSDGSAWERSVCVYTHSSTSLTRTLISSSTGALLNLTTAAVAFVDVGDYSLGGYEAAMQTYIAGCVVTKHTGANTLDISAGAFYAPDVGRVVSYAGGSAVSPGTLGASQWNNVYIDGTGAITVVNNADPPSSTYAGTARKDGSNRRWIGTFLTDGSSNIYNFDSKETGAGAIVNLYLATVNAAPFRVLSAGTATLYTLVNLSGCIPRYVANEIFISCTATVSASGTAIIFTSVDGSSTAATLEQLVDTSKATDEFAAQFWSPMGPFTPFVYYKVLTFDSNSPAAYFDLNAYRMTR